MLELITAFRNVQTADGRDKIYAFRGIAADMEKTPLPNYTQSDAYVYHEFAKYFVSHGQGMDLICEAGLNETSTEIPSWVVDWSFVADLPNFNYNQPKFGPGLYCLGELHQSKHNTEVILTDDPLIISVKGVMTDTVISVTNGLNPFGETNDTFKDFYSFDIAACRLLRSSNKHINRYSTSLLDAYARTILGGDTSFGDPLSLYEEAKLQDGQSQETESRRLKRFGSAEFVDSYIDIREQRVDKRRFGVTQKGYMRLFPVPAAEGDSICFFKGCKAPFILRKSGNAYILVGDSYVHGLTQEDVVGTEGLDYEDILLK